MRIPTVVCAVCSRPVEKITSYQDYVVRAYKFEVSCHGATERCVLTCEDVVVDSFAIVEAVAFKTKQLA